MDPKRHWEQVYGGKAADALSWFEPHAATSLALIGAAIVYIVLVFILTRILNWLERYLNKDRERPVSMSLAQAASAGPR